MGGSQTRPINSNKNVQSYKSVMGVEHKPEKTIFDKIMGSGESYKDVPYTYNDTQEEKLRKVREELLKRIDSHTHADVTQLINTVATQMNALSSKVELLEITVKAQAAFIEQMKESITHFTVNKKCSDDVIKSSNEEWIRITVMPQRLKKIGINVAVSDISKLLFAQKYIAKHVDPQKNFVVSYVICKDNKDWDRVITDELPSKGTAGVMKFSLSKEYYNNVLIPYFKKRQEVLKNFDNQFKNNEGC